MLAVAAPRQHRVADARAGRHFLAEVALGVLLLRLLGDAAGRQVVAEHQHEADEEVAAALIALMP